MFLISEPNLEEIHREEDYFFWLKVIILNRYEEEKQDINKILNLNREGLQYKVRRQVASLVSRPFRNTELAIYACNYNAPAYSYVTVEQLKYM